MIETIVEGRTSWLYCKIRTPAGNYLRANTKIAPALRQRDTYSGTEDLVAAGCRRNHQRPIPLHRNIYCFPSTSKEIGTPVLGSKVRKTFWPRRVTR
jgi:hypothetical protein